MAAEEKNPYYVEVGERLRLLMVEMGIADAAKLADRLEEGHSRVRNWLNGGSLPPISCGIKIKQEMRVTLDWLYHNDHSGLTEKKWLRLRAAREGLAPASVVDDDEAAAPKEHLRQAPAAKKASAKRVSKAPAI